MRGGREGGGRSRCEEREAPVGSNRSPMRAATFRSRRRVFLRAVAAVAAVEIPRDF